MFFSTLAKLQCILKLKSKKQFTNSGKILTNECVNLKITVRLISLRIGRQNITQQIQVNKY